MSNYNLRHFWILFLQSLHQHSNIKLDSGTIKYINIIIAIICLYTRRLLAVDYVECLLKFCEMLILLRLRSENFYPLNNDSCLSSKYYRSWTTRRKPSSPCTGAAGKTVTVSALITSSIVIHYSTQQQSIVCLTLIVMRSPNVNEKILAPT